MGTQQQSEFFLVLFEVICLPTFKVLQTTEAGLPPNGHYKSLEKICEGNEAFRGRHALHLDLRRANIAQDIIPDNNTFCKNFLDLLRKIFVYDPQQRITAKQALQHPWFQNKAQADDGTEAAKIRLQRIQAAEEAAAAAAAAPRHNGYHR